MTCLKNDILILHIDKALSGKIKKRTESHLAACSHCRTRLKALEGRLQRVLNSMQMLEPLEVPPGVFIPPQKKEKRSRFTNLARGIRLDMMLKPVHAGIALVIVIMTVLLGLFYFPGTRQKPEPIAAVDYVAPGAEERFALHSITMAGRPARTYIITEKASKTTIIWVENRM